MTTATRKYPPGSLVRARGRDWVAIPSDEEDVVRLRPVDGADDDATGIYLLLEPDAVQPSDYPPPDPALAGDFTGALLLQDPVRLALRSGAGLFRSLGRLSVVPRPYQYVPLIMALRANCVLVSQSRVLVGTSEAHLFALEGYALEPVAAFDGAPDRES